MTVRRRGSPCTRAASARSVPRETYNAGNGEVGEGDAAEAEHEHHPGRAHEEVVQRGRVPARDLTDDTLRREEVLEAECGEVGRDQEQQPHPQPPRLRTGDLDPLAQPGEPYGDHQSEGTRGNLPTWPVSA